MTKAEIKLLPYGTPIRAKKYVKCLDEYKYGGILIFRKGGKFGIMTKKSFCTDFKAEELEKIPLK